jgi:hypothetical protein
MEFKNIMQIYELLDRFELLYPYNTKLSDLRRSYIDRDLTSIFRLLPNTVSGDIDDLRKAVLEKNLHSIFRLVDDEDLRKLVIEDNVWKLWPILERYVDTQFVAAFKNFFVNNIKIDPDCFSRGQLQSKLWLVEQLKKCDVDLGTVFLCAGWYGTLATMLFESKIKVDKIRSFDIDSSCASIAEIFNKPWLVDNWKFKATTKNIMDIDYDYYCYKTLRSDGSESEIVDSPDTVINTSCEHLNDFIVWYSKIPTGKLVVIQANDYHEVEEHVNTYNTLEEFSASAPMTTVLYEGKLELPKYKRFMKIGFR